MDGDFNCVPASSVSVRKFLCGIGGRCSNRCLVAVAAIANMSRPSQSHSRQSLGGALKLAVGSGAGSRKPILRASLLCV
jgi:hypothetical protein